MSLNLTILDSHLQRIFTDIPMNLIRNGVLYKNAAIRNSQVLSQVLEIGGVDNKIDFELYIRRSLFSEQPRMGEVWKIQESTGWSIVKVVTIKPSADGLTITCGMSCANIAGGVNPTGYTG